MTSALEHLINSFTQAKLKEAKFVAVKIQMDGFAEVEVTTNENNNIDSKLEYYVKNYDSELNHKFAKGIRISGFTYGESYDIVQAHLN
jgi:hypothetical protein